MDSVYKKKKKTLTELSISHLKRYKANQGSLICINVLYGVKINLCDIYAPTAEDPIFLSNIKYYYFKCCKMFVNLAGHFIQVLDGSMDKTKFTRGI